MSDTSSVSYVDKKSAESPIFEKLSLITVVGDEIDVFGQLISLNIYEDIYSPVLTGDITLLDNINLFYKIPICGQEKLTVRFYSWNYDPVNNLKVNYFHRTFDVLRVTNVKQVNDYSTMYTLHFASPELLKNETIKISKAYSDVTHSDIVNMVMTEDYDVDEPLGLSFPTEELTEKITRSPFISDNEITAQFQKIDEQDSVELFIEKTKYKEPWITIPYMKPFDIIQWVASRSLRLSSGRKKTKPNNESANFLFFENKRGFQFTSIDTLLENKESIRSIFKMGSGAQNKNNYSERNVYTNRIHKLQIQDCYDTLNNIRSGLYASRLYSYDFNTGETIEKDYDYLESFIESESSESGKSGPPITIWEGVSEYPFIKIDAAGENDLTKKFLSKRIMIPFMPGKLINNITNEQTERDCNTRTEIGHEAYIQRRMSQLARWTNFRIIMEVPGNSVNKVGDVIEVHLNDLQYKNNNLGEFSEIPSKYYHGYYLTTSIRHSLTKFTYKQFIEAGKDSYRTLIGTIER
jgi:hypothetical protein